MNTAAIMLPLVCTAYLHTYNSVRQGLEIMHRYGYTAIPVLDEEEKYVGCVSEGDFLRHVLATGETDTKAHERYKIDDIIRKDFCPPLEITATLPQVVDAVLDQNFVPIVDGRGCRCGIVTRRSVIVWLSKAKDIENAALAPSARNVD